MLSYILDPHATQVHCMNHNNTLWHNFTICKSSTAFMACYTKVHERFNPLRASYPCHPFKLHFIHCLVFIGVQPQVNFSPFSLTSRCQAKIISLAMLTATRSKVFNHSFEIWTWSLQWHFLRQGSIWAGINRHGHECGMFLNIHECIHICHS